jgi:hypothetical protein
LREWPVIRQSEVARVGCLEGELALLESLAHKQGVGVQYKSRVDVSTNLYTNQFEKVQI